MNKHGENRCVELKHLKESCHKGVDVFVTLECIHLYILYCTPMFLSGESFVFHCTSMFLLGESLI